MQDSSKGRQSDPHGSLEIETEAEVETDRAKPKGASTAATGARARAFGEQALGEGSQSRRT